MIERALAPFEVRPHWGKLFTIPSAQLQERYPMSAEFKRLVAEHDPRGKFRNAFLTAHLYG
jgi:xylitol oxidase